MRHYTSNQTVTAGTGVIVKSQVIAIPATFIGTATLKFTVTLNKKPVVIKPVAVVIQPQVSQKFSLLDVGFGETVELDASVISTYGMKTPFVYTWTQKPNALGQTITGNLSATNVAKPTLTTALSDFVTVNEETVETTNALTGNVTSVTTRWRDTVGRPSEARTNDLVGIENEQVAGSTYVYEVQVKGSSGNLTRNATFTVTCAVQSLGTHNIPLGVNSQFMGDIGASGNNTTTWTLVDKPANSTANLTHGTDVIAQLKPDVAGNYTISFSTTDGVTGNVTTGNLTKTAATFVKFESTSCQTCHTDVANTWALTGHASMAQRGIDGEVSAYYNESCLQCHAVGYNAAASAANNGNFKAVANQIGWKFPTELKAGNFAAMPEKLQKLANVQCESCHGPGSAHNGTPGTMVPSLDVQVCASCHQDGQHHNRVAQWENGPHSAGFNVFSGEGRNPPTLVGDFNRVEKWKTTKAAAIRDTT